VRWKSRKGGRRSLERGAGVFAEKNGGVFEQIAEELRKGKKGTSDDTPEYLEGLDIRKHPCLRGYSIVERNTTRNTNEKVVSPVQAKHPEQEPEGKRDFVVKCHQSNPGVKRSSSWDYLGNILVGNAISEGSIPHAEPKTRLQS